MQAIIVGYNLTSNYTANPYHTNAGYCSRIQLKKKRHFLLKGSHHSMASTEFHNATVNPLQSLLSTLGQLVWRYAVAILGLVWQHLTAESTETRCLLLTRCGACITGYSLHIFCAAIAAFLGFARFSRA